uniref:Putative secreted peptide n=1 Tax=Anopheles braziliensis TaxID=58242 RepID=A0A2M3ZR53_9DIPT
MAFVLFVVVEVLVILLLLLLLTAPPPWPLPTVVRMVAEADILPADGCSAVDAPADTVVAVGEDDPVAEMGFVVAVVVAVVGGDT